LYRISAVIRNIKNSPIIIAGDFNARHGNWDSRDTNNFGKKLFDWLVVENFVVLNKKDETTCRRYQGESVIDLTLVNSQAKKMITQWRIEEDRPILSDHCVISMKINARIAKDIFIQNSEKFPKWNYKKIDIDFLTGYAECQVWGMGLLGEFSTMSLVDWISETMRDFSEVSMPRSYGVRKEATYWWNEDIAEYRAKTISARRKVTRYKKNRNDLEFKRLHKEYKLIVKNYKKLIWSAKKVAWNELLKDLDKDPWGMAFKIVTKKLTPAVPSVCETLPWKILNKVINVLFPDGEGIRKVPGPLVWTSNDQVTSREIREVTKRLYNEKKAPGPDGILGGIVKVTMNSMERVWTKCFSDCLERGIFPACWKVARLVLLKKRGCKLRP
jgi:hypothetical protein